MDEQKNKSSVPLTQKLAWGTGGFAENLANNVLPTLAYPIFAIGMGISPFYIGLAMSASRVVDAVTDPLMGNITDNTKSRWGRRKPWVLIGGILMAVIFASIWFVPRIQEGGSQAFSAVYLIIICSLFYMAFTVWVVPFSALGLELAVDYTERTRLMIFRVVPSFIVGILIGSLYKITLMKDVWGGDEVVGARYVCLILAAFMLITAILSVFVCKERYAKIEHEKIKMWPAIIATFKDRPFQLLIGSAFFVFVALFFMLPLLTYISLYYVCQGDKQLMGTIGVYTAIVQTTTQLLSMAVISYVAKFFDKKTVLISGLFLGIFGYVSSWFLFTPELPYLTVLPPVIINIGLCACWVLNGSFSADICDYDELKTGRRREGMYSAVFGFLSKLAIALVMSVSSLVLVKIGFKGGNENPTAQQLFTLRWVYIAIPTIAMFSAILCMWRYPLSKARVAEIQTELEAKRGVTSLED